MPELDQAYSDLGQPFEVFIKDHMLPRIDEELDRLTKEDHELFSKGREALGVKMESMADKIFDEGFEDSSEDGEKTNSEDDNSEVDSFTCWD